MEIVKLTVKVDDSQLQKLEAAVDKIKSTTIEPKTDQATNGMRQFAKATEDAARQTESLWDNVQKFARWYVIGNTIGTLTRSIREALETMKEVDSELTNIQKVSGMTAQEISKIGDAAYDVASKFGVAVEDYLASVYEFQKAGLGDSATQMAELATKTQLVGDTSAEVANKFIVASNAAWKMNGDMERLSMAVDQADYINNNYATTLEKLADAMPIVASTAANMNMSFEETLALLGTINSKTQETGRKTATAVRSFLIAISGQVGEFVDDVGETYEVTTQNVEALTDALKIYGNEAVQAAIQTGQIINPMEALNSLAQAYKDGLIDDISLQEMLIKVAGKMRYNQLVTIVKDLASESSTYREILEQLPMAAGTADKEIGTMLTSWQAKTQILSNTWTEFISHLVETDGVKAGLDLLTGVINLLDSTIGQAAAKAALLTAAFAGINAISKNTLIPAITLLIDHFMGVSSAELLAAESSGTLATAMNAIPGMAIVTVLGLLIYGFYRLAEANKEVTVSTEELQSRYQEASSELSALQKKLNENKTLIEEANRVAGNETYVRRLEAENVQLERQIELQKIAKQDAARDLLNGMYETVTTKPNEYTGDPLYRVRTILDSAQNEELAQYAEMFKNELQELIPVLNDYISATEAAEAVGIALSDAQIEARDTAAGLIDEYISLYNATTEIEPMTEAVIVNTEAIAERMQALGEQIDEVQSAISTLSAAQEEYNENGSISIDTLQKLLTLDGEYLQAIFDETGALDLNGDAVANLLTDKSKLLEALAAEAVANYAAEEASRLLAEQTGETGSEADTAAGRLQAAAQAAFNSGVSAANAANGWWELNAAIRAVAGEVGLDQMNTNRLVSNVTAYAQGVKNLLSSAGSGVGSWTGSSYSSSGSKSGGSKSGSGKSAEQEALEAEKKRLQKEKKLMQKQREQEIEDIDAQREAVQAEKKRLKALRDEDMDSFEAEKKRLQAQRDAELAALDEQIALLKKNHTAQQNANNIAELQLAVEEAELALLNAQNERTVRYYNEATGQWEWIANQAEVIAKEQALEDARQALADALAQQAYNEQLETLQEQRENLSDAWKKTLDALDAQKEAQKAYWDKAIKEQDDLLDVLDEQKKGLQKYWKDAIDRLDDTIDTINEKLSDLKITVNVNTGGSGGGSGGGGGGGGSGGGSGSGSGWTDEKPIKTGTDVLNLQNFLNAYFGTRLSQDGIYNSATRNAVRDMQRKIGQAQTDGYYTALTVKALKKYSPTYFAQNAMSYDGKIPAAIYDRGGILRGMGGIKATYADEIILPPQLAKRMLSPVADGVFAKRLAEMGWLYGAQNHTPQSLAGTVDNRIGSQHNGNVYQFGDVRIDEQTAKSTTIYDFARASRNLPLYSWGN